MEKEQVYYKVVMPKDPEVSVSEGGSWVCVKDQGTDLVFTSVQKAHRAMLQLQKDYEEPLEIIREAYRIVYYDYPGNTLKGRYELVNALSERLKETLVDNLKKMPNYWDGFELRWLMDYLIKTQFLFFPSNFSKRSKRWHDFLNTLRINNFS